LTLNNVEKFRAKIEAGHVCVGSAISFSDAAVSELFGEAGYDFTWIDMEHCPIDLGTALGHIMAVRGTEAAPFVRVPANDPVLIKPVLDLAPAAIIVPLIRTHDGAAQAVRACKYPPAGIRGYGPRRGTRFGAVPQTEYLENADSQTMVVIQIEHIDAIGDLDAILATPGLDAVCLGPNDLSGSMGLLGQIDHPDVIAAIDMVVRKVRETDLYLGVATGYTPETTRRWLEKGIQWMCLNTDYGSMFTQARAVLDGVRETERILNRSR